MIPVRKGHFHRAGPGLSILVGSGQTDARSGQWHRFPGAQFLNHFGRPPQRRTQAQDSPEGQQRRRRRREEEEGEWHLVATARAACRTMIVSISVACSNSWETLTYWRGLPLSYFRKGDEEKEITKNPYTSDRVLTT